MLGLLFLLKPLLVGKRASPVGSGGDVEDDGWLGVHG